MKIWLEIENFNIVAEFFYWIGGSVGFDFQFGSNPQDAGHIAPMLVLLHYDKWLENIMDDKGEIVTPVTLAYILL